MSTVKTVKRGAQCTCVGEGGEVFHIVEVQEHRVLLAKWGPGGPIHGWEPRTKITLKPAVLGFRVKDSSGQYVVREGEHHSAQRKKPETVSRAEAHRILAGWLDAGYLGSVVVVRK